MKPVYRYDIEQGSDEWYALRLGKMTGSHAHCIQAKPTTRGKNAGRRQGLETYCCEIVKELLFGRQEGFTNEAMERGNELEDEAVMVYSLEKGLHVEKCGFVSLGDYCGISPDGLIGEDGGVEIKNHDESVFLRLINTEEIDLKYIAQIHMNLYVTGREWWDYVGYNQNFKKPFIKRFHLDDKTKALFKDGLEFGESYIKNALEKTKEYY